MGVATFFILRVFLIRVQFFFFFFSFSSFFPFFLFSISKQRRTFSRWFSLGSCNTQTKCGLPHHLQTRENTHFFIFPLFKNPYRMRSLPKVHFFGFFGFFGFFRVFEFSKPYNSRLPPKVQSFFDVIS